MEKPSLNAKSMLLDELHPVSQQVDYGMDDLPPRPHTVMSGSLHSSSFRIVDNFFQRSSNPLPITQQTNSSKPSEMKDQILSPRRLREVSGVEDLSQITYIELSVNTTTTSIGNFGVYLPNLQQLSLYKSVVHSIRDLGTSLGSLKVLWMARCSLRDLDGLAALPSLQELYVADNEITDVSLVSLLSELEVLDLESNFIADSDQLGYLCLCQKLMVLSLNNNPISNNLNESGLYRETIEKNIPQLKVLDEIPFDGVDTSCLKSVSSYSLMSPSMVESTWRDVNKGLLSPHYLQENKETRDSGSNKMSPQRPLSSLSTSSRGNNRDFELLSKDSPPTEDSSTSELTHGLNQVICGNPIRALRKRQKDLLSSQSSVTFTSSMEQTNPGLPTMMEENYSSEVTRINEDGKLQLMIPLPPPTQPISGAPPTRPHTASDFRSRRYHRPNHSRSLTAAANYHHHIEEPDKSKDTSIDDGQEKGIEAGDHENNKLLLTAKTKPIRTRRVYRTRT